MTDFIDEFARKLCQYGFANSWQIRGCWEREIDVLENHFEIKLPDLYKSFLKKMGHSAGEFMVGTDFFYKHLFDNRKAMEDVLASDGYPLTLGQTDFVFYSHQGYIFHFFETIPLFDDPPVYVYSEGEMDKEMIDTTFSSFLNRILEDLLKIRSSTRLNLRNE